MQAIDLGEEDDMEPLLAALSKAQARADKMIGIRQANEAEALDIAGMAIAMQDKLKSYQARNPLPPHLSLSHAKIPPRVAALPRLAEGRVGAPATSNTPRVTPTML